MNRPLRWLIIIVYLQLLIYEYDTRRDWYLLLTIDKNERDEYGTHTLTVGSIHKHCLMVFWIWKTGVWTSPTNYHTFGVVVYACLANCAPKSRYWCYCWRGLKKWCVLYTGVRVCVDGERIENWGKDKTTGVVNGEGECVWVGGWWGVVEVRLGWIEP